MIVKIWKCLANLLEQMAPVNTVESVTYICLKHKPIWMTFQINLNLMYQELRSSLDSNSILSRSKESTEVFSFLPANGFSSIFSGKPLQLQWDVHHYPFRKSNET